MLKYCTVRFLYGWKKSNFLENHFKLSGFSLKIYNVNAGNRRYASVNLRSGVIFFFFLLHCFFGRLQSMIAGYASVSFARTGTKIHQIANQKRDYIEKYVNIIYALGSAHVWHVKFDVWIEVDLLPFYSWGSIRQDHSNRTAESTKYKSAVPNIDSYVELYKCRT